MPVGLPEIIRASSGFLLGGLGVALLVIRPRTRASLAFAVLLLALVPFFTAANLLYADDFNADPLIPLYTVLFLLATGLCVIIARELAANATIANRSLGLGIACGAVTIAIYDLVPYEGLGGYTLYVVMLQDIALYLYCGAAAGLFCVFAHRASVSTTAADAGGFAYLAAGLAVYPLALTLILSGELEGSDAFIVLAGNLVLLIPFAIGIHFLARARSGAAPRPATAALGATIGCGVFSTIGFASPLNPALIGIVRGVSLLLLLVAIFRFGVLGHDTRAGTRQRAGLAGMAIAALLIVAQVAQNFFSAQYGLLMGGVVAGALLVAARPIERALEGQHDRAVPVPVGHGRLGTYRTAVRYALRDGKVTRAEETHLSELAQDLGIGAADAMRIRHEVEDEPRPEQR